MTDEFTRKNWISQLNLDGNLFSFDTSCFDYQQESGDIFIVSYPRCGQTWSRYMLWTLLANDGQPMSKDDNISHVVPSFEHVGSSGSKAAPQPRILATHLMLNMLPYSHDAKYLLLTRNPKDVQVSYFYHNQGLGWVKDTEYQKHFEHFLNGKLLFGSYFEHQSSYLPFLDRRNVKLVFYEQLRGQTADQLREIAEFLEKKIPEETIQRTVLTTSLDEMQIDQQRFMSRETFEKRSQNPDAVSFVRKGEVGGWKDKMSYEQSLAIDKKYRECFSRTAAEHWFDDYM